MCRWLKGHLLFTHFYREEKDIMKYTLENETLTIYLEGEMNTANAEAVEGEIRQIIGRNSFSSIVLDLEHLTYLTSAGLRVMICLKQEYGDVSLVKASEGIYGILYMVGLHKLMKIEKLS